MSERGKYFTEMFGQLNEDDPESDRISELMFRAVHELEKTLEDFKVATYGYSSALRTDADIRKIVAVTRVVQKAFEDYKKI